MPCPPPGLDERTAALREQASLKNDVRAGKKAEAIRLHRVLREPHNVIMSRLKITRPTLVAWLREAGEDGNSAKPTPEADEALGDSGIPVYPTTSPRSGMTPKRSDSSLHVGSGRSGSLVLVGFD